ncbi:MAG: hypothetical protein O3A46_05700 [Candidatus Poribacteria bacterium]|nr:hypothetical protein [Candidatus Poribacteria bacterium]
MTTRHRFATWLRQEFDKHCGTSETDLRNGCEPEYTLWQSELDLLIRRIVAQFPEASGSGRESDDSADPTPSNGPRMLPLLVIGRKIYFVDRRLSQLRDAENPRDWDQLTEQQFEWLMRIADFDPKPREIG